MKPEPRSKNPHWNRFPGLAGIWRVTCLLAVLSPLHAATVVTDISEENSNADGVEASLDRRKNLESLFPDWEVPKWMQAYRKKREEWLDWLGLDIGATYDTAGLAAYGGGGPDYGLSGDLTVNGLWLLTGKKWKWPLDFHFRIRHRHAIGGQAASEVASASGDVFWNMIDGFTDAGLEVPDVHLLQHFPKHDLKVRLGQMTIDSHFDRHGLRSSKHAFFNRAFSSNPAVAFPRFGMGVVATWKPEKIGFDFTLGSSTVQGTQNGTQVDFSLGSSDFFTAFQVGRDFKLWGNSARGQAMAWHSDAVESDDTPKGSGGSLTFERWIASSNNRFFVRAAWADGEAADVDRLLSTGLALERRDNDLFGIAAGLGRDSGGDDDWQAVIETFYRLQIGPAVQITPEMQVVFGNELGPSHSFRFVAGFRADIAF